MLNKTKVGQVSWEILKDDLMELPKETLAEMVNMWIQNYWSCQSYWVSYVERDFGVDAAVRLDGEVFEKTARIQGKRLKQLLSLNNDMETMAFVLKHTSPQWTPAGFDWEITDVTDKHITFQVKSCPMSKFRKANNLEVFPCKQISPPLYTALAKSINPKMRAICTHAHPDEAKEGIMCQWEFIYEEE